MTLDEIRIAFQTPLTQFKSGKIIQTILLNTAADSDQDLAAKRCLSLMEGSDLRPLFLATYPTFTISQIDLDASNKIIDIYTTLVPYRRVILRAINELKIQLPDETLNLLQDYLVKESPIDFLNVIIFTIIAMTLYEAGELT